MKNQQGFSAEALAKASFAMLNSRDQIIDALALPESLPNAGDK